MDLQIIQDTLYCGEDCMKREDAKNIIEFEN